MEPAVFHVIKTRWNINKAQMIRIRINGAQVENPQILPGDDKDVSSPPLSTSTLTSLPTGRSLRTSTTWE